MEESDAIKICEENDWVFISIDEDENSDCPVVYFVNNGFLMKSRVVSFPLKQYKRKNFVDSCDYHMFVKHKLYKTHNYKYEYIDFKLNNPKDKIRIRCERHGVFEMLYTNHLVGKGCNLCSHEEVAIKNTRSPDDFIGLAREVHGDRYGYNDVVYEKSNLPVKILCTKHGEFYQLPVVHLTGCGCPKCGDESATQKKVEKGACGHSRGSYCKHVDESGVYLFRLSKKGSIVYKIGITKNLRQRILNVSNESGCNVSCMFYKKMNPFDAYDAEKLLHKSFKEFRITSSDNFKGKTECFESVDMKKFLDVINCF